MKSVTLIVLCLSLTIVSHAQTSLFTYNSTWKYLDNGTDQGTAWQSPTFDDGAWSTGNGKFGYGLPGLATVVSYGPNVSQKYITTYFRKTINIPDPNIFSSFTAGVLRDDGIVVYVNGLEVYRNRMKDDTVTYTTFGVDAEDNASITQVFDINKSFFVSGNNVIAVEIHQKTVTNADLGFDMQLSGNGAAIDLTPPFAVSISRQNPPNQFTQNVAVTYRATFSEKIRGLDKTDLTLTTVAGTVTGVLPDTAVTAVSADSLSYDILVDGIQGNGTLRLDLNAGGTGITDTAGNAINSGFTNGETYNIEQGGAPFVTGITRQLPANENTDTTAVTIASGIKSEDICAIAYLPGKIGVCWTNQNAKRFGFKIHLDGDDPSTWSADEVPASQSALSAGNGMADNYLNMIAGSDGTLYCAVKTGYDKNGLPAIALLVRRPNNTWDNLYPVTSSKEGNRPIVILNEATAKIKVMYSTHLDNFDNTRSGDILYRESSTSSISFGPPITLLAGNGINHYEYTTSTHQTYDPAIVIFTMLENLSPNTVAGILATDPVTPPANGLITMRSGLKTQAFRLFKR